MTKTEVAEILRTSPRIGTREDKPEGTRYIVLSDTLANQMADALVDTPTARRKKPNPTETLHGA